MFIIRTNSEIRGVRFVALEGKPTDEELEEYLQAEIQRVPRETQFDGVTVLALGHAWTSTQRKRMREFEQEVAAKTDLPQLGLAMVVPNSLIRGAFTAYFWIAPAAYPTTMVATPADAYTFICERLRAAALPVPDAQRFKAVALSQWSARVARPGEGLVPLDALETAHAS